MPARYEIPLPLRWSDQDLLGHVNNATIVTLAEEARVRFHSEAGQVSGGDAENARVVARQTIDYHAPAMYGPELTMHVGVVRLGSSSYTLRQQGHQEGRAVFTADSVIVTLGEDGRSRPLTDVERKALGQWTWPEDG